MDVELVHNMYHYYDLQNSKYEAYVSEISYFKDIKSKNDLENNVMELYDKKNKKILRATYQYLGRYYPDDKTWKWAWSIPMHKSLNYFIKKIFDYGFNIVIDEKQYDIHNILYLIKLMITNSIIKIVNIDFILALAMYISKAEYIWGNNFDNYFNYYLLKDIEIL
jgi:hypothetical protein